MATLNKYTTYSYTFANPNTSGDTILIPAVGNKRIRIISILAVAAGVVTVKFKSGTTIISGDCDLVANSGFSHESIVGIFLTEVNKPFTINLSTSTKVGLTITYELI